MQSAREFGTQDLHFVRISSFAVDESVGCLVQVSLMFFAFTGSARLRLTCTSQPMD